MSRRRFEVRVLQALLVLGTFACGPADRVFVPDDPEMDASNTDVGTGTDSGAPPDGGSGGGMPDTSVDVRRDVAIDARLDVASDNAQPDRQSDTVQNDTSPGDVASDAIDAGNDDTNDGATDTATGDAPPDVACADGSYRCTSANLEICQGGSWVVRATCATPALCDAVGGMCTPPACLPNNYRCQGTSLQICNADQNGWVDKEMCASAALCDAARGICSTSACTPGAYQCSGATLQVCRTDQTGWDTVMVCAAPPLCNAMTGMCDVAPETTIDTYPPNPSNAINPSFTFSSSKMGSTFQCRLDGGAYAVCTSPSAVAVGSGAHTFEVYAVDAGGVADATPAAYTWTVDTAPPTVTIVTKPANPTKLVDASFNFSSTESGTTECRIDGGAWGVCSSPTTMQYLSLTANTSHTFDVRVTDAAQNVGSASYTWTIDTIAPTTTITGGPPSVIYIRDASFVFTANEGATFECSVDGGSFAACTSPRAVNGMFVGSHTLTVRATDAAGNVENPGASRSWTVAYPVTCTRATVGSTSTAGVSSGAAWRVCRSDWTTWVSSGTGGGTYNAVTACRSIGYRSVPQWGGNFNQVCTNEAYNQGGGSDPTNLSITVEWLCDDCGAPPAVNLTGSVGVNSGAAWKVCRADWDTAWISAQSGGGNYNAVQACQYLGYRTVDAWGGNANQVCTSESYNQGGGSDPTNLSITVHWRCTY